MVQWLHTDAMLQCLVGLCEMWLHRAFEALRLARVVHDLGAEEVSVLIHRPFFDAWLMKKSFFLPFLGRWNSLAGSPGGNLATNSARGKPLVDILFLFR